MHTFSINAGVGTLVRHGQAISLGAVDVTEVYLDQELIAKVEGSDEYSLDVQHVLDVKLFTDEGYRTLAKVWIDPHQQEPGG